MKKSINTRWFYVLSMLLLTAIFRPAELFAQDRLTLVSGTVVTESGAPVPGATVAEIGTTNGVATDRSGAFSISVREKSSLKISFVGYLDITVPAATAQTRFVLREDVVQACTRGHSVDNRSYIEYECDKAVRDGLNIVVLYNAATVNKSKCPDAVKNVGTHTAMCYYENGTYYWDYQAVKTALGQ